MNARVEEKPVAPAERHEIIDCIRGFALFGVLYINLLWTSQYVAADSAPEGLFESGPLDTAVFFFSQFFINHKFYALFSILFGLGFAIQMASARERGKTIARVYARRLAILFAIGLIHAFFIWPEDVLHIYALLGFPLILLRNSSDKTLLTWIGAIFALTIAVTVVQWSVLDKQPEQDSPPQIESVDTSVEKTVRDGPYQQILSEDYADVIQFNWDEMRRKYTNMGIGPGSNVYWYLTILWKFLLGMFIGRKMLLQRAQDHLQLYKRMLPWALGLGLGGHAVAFVAFGPLEEMMFGSAAIMTVLWFLIEVGMLALSIFYLSALVLWYQTPSGKRILSWLAPLGRMALTNYLMHSVIFIVIFYGIGFGMLGKGDHAVSLPIAIAIFVAQIVFSTWWLKRFRFGPMEWLWRSLTYSKLQPMRIGSVK